MISTGVGLWNLSPKLRYRSRVAEQLSSDETMAGKGTQREQTPDELQRGRGRRRRIRGPTVSLAQPVNESMDHGKSP